MDEEVVAARDDIHGQHLGEAHQIRLEPFLNSAQE
jgi:hypothetical protein